MLFIKGHFKMAILIISLILVIALTFLSFLPEFPLSNNQISMMGILVALFSSLVALLMPFILIFVENKRKEEKKTGVRVICKNAIKEICDFCISQYDTKTNAPKDIIEEDKRLEIIKAIELLNMYKTEALEMGIVLSSGWQEKIGQDLHIFIFLEDKLEIELNSPSYGKVIRAAMKHKGKYVKKKDEIAPILKKLEDKIS